MTRFIRNGLDWRYVEASELQRQTNVSRPALFGLADTASRVSADIHFGSLAGGFRNANEASAASRRSRNR